MYRTQLPCLLCAIATALPVLAFEEAPAYAPPPAAGAVRQHPLPEQFAAIEKGAWQEVQPAIAPLTDSLIAAAAAGDAERVRKLIADGAQPNGADARGERALCAAVASGALEATRILLQRGADPDRKGLQGRPPLAIAAANGQRRIVGLLLAAGADPDRAGATRATPLHEAVRFGHSAIDALLAAGVPPDLADRKGLTALHWSRRDQQPLAEALLLERGAGREAWPLVPR